MPVWFNLTSAWIPEKEGWSFMRPVKIVERSGNDLTDFQVKVELNSSNFDFSRANADGSDIRFADESGRQLPYWVESWDASGEQAVVWVKVPSIPASGTATIYMYYSNPSATSESDKTQVFYQIDSVYLEYRINEGSGATLNDGSGTSNIASTIYGATWTSGTIDYALYFDGSNDYTKTTSTFGLTNGVTIEAIVRIVDTSSNYEAFVYHGTANEWGLWKDPNRHFHFGFRASDGSWNTLSGNLVYDTSKWYHVVARYSINDGYIRIFVDGELDAEKYVGKAMSTGTDELWLGTKAQYEWTNCYIDEVRIFSKGLSNEEASYLSNGRVVYSASDEGVIFVRKYTDPEPTVTVRTTDVWLA